MRFPWALIFFLSSTLHSALYSAPVERLERARTEYGYVTVHYPKEFDPQKSYHVFFWFHGTGGKPSRGMSVAHPRYIGVGMSYLKGDEIPAGEYGAAHWQECLSVRKELVENGLKLKRNIVGGVSKGGWASFYIGNEVPTGPDAPHGIVIVAAGKDPRMKEPPKMTNALSVLVGTGETDPNFPQAQLAVQYFRKGGASVSYEEWLGRGHTYDASPQVLDWLEVESLKSRPELLKRTADAKLREKLQACEKIAEPVARYVAFRHLVSHPFFPHASDALRKDARKQGRELAADETIQPWLEQLKTLRTLVNREAGFLNARSFDVPKLRLLSDRYRKFISDTNDPALAARAAYGVRRVDKMSEIYTAQSKAFETPEFKQLSKEYSTLQRTYSEADGKPGEAVMAKLSEIGGKLSKLKFEAGMEAFKNAEWKEKPKPDPELDTAIRLDPVDRLRPYSGVGF